MDIMFILFLVGLSMFLLIQSADQDEAIMAAQCKINDLENAKFWSDKAVERLEIENKDLTDKLETMQADSTQEEKDYLRISEILDIQVSKSKKLVDIIKNLH